MFRSWIRVPQRPCVGRVRVAELLMLSLLARQVYFRGPDCGLRWRVGAWRGLLDPVERGTVEFLIERHPSGHTESQAWLLFLHLLLSLGCHPGSFSSAEKGVVMNAVYGHILSHKAPGGGLGLRRDCHTPTPVRTLRNLSWVREEPSQQPESGVCLCSAPLVKRDLQSRRSVWL